MVVSDAGDHALKNTIMTASVELVPVVGFLLSVG